ncbi:MAG: sodium:solute symporter family transporter [Chlorobiales bacterium]
MIFGVGIFVLKFQKHRDSEAYFLAGRSLLWWVVGASLIASNISALGALTMETVLGIDLITGIVGLAVLFALYTIYGGLAIAAWTDAVHSIG